MTPERKLQALMMGMGEHPNPKRSDTPDYADRTRKEIADLCVAVLEKVPPVTMRKGKPIRVKAFRAGRIAVPSENRLTSDNEKLKGIVCWSLPAVTTCPSCAECKSSCFAMKSQMGPFGTVFRQRFENLYLWAEEPELLERMLDRQIERDAQVKKRRDFRVHVSGDFFSQEYVEWWAAFIRARAKRFRFYGYSKAEEHFDLAPLTRAGMNIVQSNIPGVGLNFTQSFAPEGIAEARAMVKDAAARGIKAIVCPATVKKEVKCGEKRWGGSCSWCLDHSHTVFVRH